MVRFKSRWLLLAIDDKPLSAASPFPPTSDNDSTYASTSVSALSAAQKQATLAHGAANVLTPQLITRLLRASLVCNFGDVAAGAFGGVLTCKYYSTHTGTAIVRCSRDAARLVWASATMIARPVEMKSDESESFPSGEKPSLRIRVVHCGGTIKKVQNKAIELDRKLIMRLRAKQKRLAGTTRQGQSPEKVVADALTANQCLVALSALPTGEDDEDLGEALDPNVSRSEAAAASDSIVPQVEHTIKHKPKAKEDSMDFETQALLQESRKLISSITM